MAIKLHTSRALSDASRKPKHYRVSVRNTNPHSSYWKDYYFENEDKAIERAKECANYYKDNEWMEVILVDQYTNNFKYYKEA